MVEFNKSPIDDIKNFIESERGQINESDRNAMTVSLKVDAETHMGIVSDVKQELRKSMAYKINYSTDNQEKNQ